MTKELFTNQADCEFLGRVFCTNCKYRASSVCTDDYECNYERATLRMYVHNTFPDMDNHETSEEYIARLTKEYNRL